MSYSSTSGVSLNNIQLKCLQNHIFTAQLGTKSPHLPPREKSKRKRLSAVMLIVLMLVKAQNMSEDKQHVQQEEEKKCVEGNIK